MIGEPDVRIGAFGDILFAFALPNEDIGLRLRRAFTES